MNNIICKNIFYILIVNFTCILAEGPKSVYRCHGNNFAGEILCSPPCVIQVDNSFYGYSANYDPGHNSCPPGSDDCTIPVEQGQTPNYNQTIHDACDGKHECDDLIVVETIIGTHCGEPHNPEATNYVIIYFSCSSDNSTANSSTQMPYETTIDHDDSQTSIAGIVIGVVLLMIIIVCIIIFVIMKRHKNIKKPKAEQEDLQPYCEIDGVQKPAQNGHVSSKEIDYMYANRKIQKKNGGKANKCLDLIGDEADTPTEDDTYNTIAVTDGTVPNNNSAIKNKLDTYDTIYPSEKMENMTQNGKGNFLTKEGLTMLEQTDAQNGHVSSEEIKYMYANRKIQKKKEGKANKYIDILGDEEDTQAHVNNNIMSKSDKEMVENTYYESSDVQESGTNTGSKPDIPSQSLPGGDLMENTYYESSGVILNAEEIEQTGNKSPDTSKKPTNPNSAEINQQTGDISNNTTTSTNEDTENYYDPPLIKAESDFDKDSDSYNDPAGHAMDTSDGSVVKDKDSEGNYVYVYQHFVDEGRERSPHNDDN